MATVGDVIRAARDLHPRFTRERHPDGVLLRWMQRYQPELLEKLADTDPEIIRSTQTISFPLADHDAGIQLDPHLVAVGGEVQFTNGDPEPLHIRGSAYRYQERPWYSVEIIEDQLIPIGSAADWSRVTAVEFWYISEPDELEGRDSVIDLPGDPLDVMSHGAAQLMALRDPDVMTGDYSALFGLKESEYLSRVTGRRRAKLRRVREVW